MHAGFWALYGGIKAWEKELVRQWRTNGGWVLNGIGRPLGVDEAYVKDIVNRVCQSTGHDIYVLWLDIAVRLLQESGMTWHPLVADLHDAGYFEVEEARAQEALDLLVGPAYDELNRWLGGLIPLRGDGKLLAHWGEAVE